MAPHLASFRRGWENEALARYLLSRFSFVAHPASVSDDVGTDFFCTLFETVAQDRRRFLIPRNSFAIQIKSSSKRFDATNKYDYLVGLEMPFFLGAIDRKALRLDIYSGEYIPDLFSYKPPPERLKIQPCRSRVVDGTDGYFTAEDHDNYVLKFPMVAQVSAYTTADDVAHMATELRERCAVMRNNIASWHNHEYIFKHRDCEHVTVTAGSGSDRVFRRNFYDRLAEVFANLKWLYEEQPTSFCWEEFEVYEILYCMLQQQDNLPNHLAWLFDAVNELVANDPYPQCPPDGEGGASLQLYPGQRSKVQSYFALQPERRAQLVGCVREAWRRAKTDERIGGNAHRQSTPKDVQCLS